MMATQSVPHSVIPPLIPPALPPGTPGKVASEHPTAAPHADAALTSHASSLADVDILRETGGTRLTLTAPMTRMPVELQVMVPVRAFRVKNLLAMAPGLVVESAWANGDDLPLSSGEVQLAWTEFEVVDNRLAVRITRLA